MGKTSVTLAIVAGLAVVGGALIRLTPEAPNATTPDQVTTADVLEMHCKYDGKAQHNNQPHPWAVCTFKDSTGNETMELLQPESISTERWAFYDCSRLNTESSWECLTTAAGE